MKYKDIKEKANRHKYTWRLTDLKYFEFLECDWCKAEAPLHDWRLPLEMPGNSALCPLCSNGEKDNAAANFAANMMLKMLGIYDDYEVVEAGEV